MRISPIRSTALLFVIAVLAIPAAAQAKTHRFAPATELSVSFLLPKAKASGTLIRFARNHVSLSRDRGGGLTLRASGRHAHRVAARGRHHRIVVFLSTITGRVRLTVGGATVGIGGRFVAEDAVVARDHPRVAGLRIRTEAPIARPPASPVAPAGAAPAAGPTAGPAPAPAPAPRLFAPTSVWNAPLSDNAPLDHANAVLVKTLRDTAAQNEAAGWGPWVSTAETSPLYTVPADQPTVRVTLDPGSWKVGLQQTFNAVPIPAGAVPAAGPDAHMTVWQPATNRVWEFFQARKLADGWHASFGGAIANVSTSPGYYDTDSWPLLSQPWWGATATSLPAIAGTMMVSELQAGVIPHALAINIPWAKPNTYAWPAQRTDGRSTDPNAIPEGARFRIDPKLDIDKLNLPPMTRAMAKAAQRYGMIVRDQTGHAISFFAENPTRYANNPYVSPGGLYGGTDPTAVMRAFPWDHVQLVQMQLHTTS